MKAAIHIVFASAAALCALLLTACASDVRYSTSREPAPVGATLSPAGTSVLEPCGADKVPLLFVHGINGSPADFAYLLGHLDVARFQPWLYAYPSRMELDAVAADLDRTVARLQTRCGCATFAVVAHSMGGLIARGFILRHSQRSDAGRIPLFISISTPWGGHAAAELAVKYLSASEPVWRDLAPRSEYLHHLFSTELPTSTHHFLVFTFNRNKLVFGASGDQRVSMASQLNPAAQREAVRLIGFDDTHSGVLRDPALASLLNELLAAAFPQNEATANTRAPP